MKPVEPCQVAKTPAPVAIARRPYSLAEIQRHLSAETGGGKRDLFFGRTALVGDVRFWLWGYGDDKGTTYVVDVSERSGQHTLCIGGGNGLTPEQYIALRYARRWHGRSV